MSDPQAAISEFELFLRNAGLTCVRREAPEDAMGYLLIEYVGSVVRIRLVYEKSFWNLTVADTGMLPDVWYDIRLFTYLIGAPAQPRMPFAEQLVYCKEHWSEIIKSFDQNRRIRTHLRLNAAKKERANQLFARWPKPILDFESFLKEKGMICTYRREPKTLYDSMSMKYSGTVIAIQISSQDGWHIEFSDVLNNPDEWHDFRAIRQIIQWPSDKRLLFAEWFEFIKTNWTNILSLFSPSNSKDTHERLLRIENGASSR